MVLYWGNTTTTDNVGIGTSSPGALLDVNACAGAGTINISGGSGGGSNVGQFSFNRIGSGELGPEVRSRD